MNKKIQKYILSLLTIVLVTTLILSYRSYNQAKVVKNQEKNIILQTFKVEKGWGYRIIKNGRVFINQENIPAVSGNKSFRTEGDAKKVGQIVLAKVENRDIPSIGIMELDSLEIDY